LDLETHPIGTRCIAHAHTLRVAVVTQRRLAAMRLGASLTKKLLSVRCTSIDAKIARAFTLP
jgi:hypothetical protein